MSPPPDFFFKGRIREDRTLRLAPGMGEIVYVAHRSFRRNTIGGSPCGSVHVQPGLIASCPVGPLGAGVGEDADRGAA